MRAADYPKLLFSAMPGAIITPAFAAEFVKGRKNLEVVELPSGVHFHQEDHPQTIGSSVANWISRAEQLESPVRPGRALKGAPVTAVATARELPERSFGGPIAASRGLICGML
jgi:hypothetical protein